MKRVCMALGGLLIGLNGGAQTGDWVNTREPLWRQTVGLTTFRTNLLFDGQHLWVGSNGNQRERGEDERDGVYGLNPTTGSVERRFEPPTAHDHTPDGDVNGLLRHKDLLLFADDDGNVICRNLKTESLEWGFKLPAGVEGVPALVHNGATSLAVFATRRRSEYAGCHVMALEVTSGEPAWEFESDRPGDFMASPLAVDLNADGVEDVVLGSGNNGGDHLYALNGKNGQLLWKQEVGSGIHASATLSTWKGKACILSAQAYSVVSKYDFKGNELAAWELLDLENVGISGLFSSPVELPDGTLVMGTSWWGSNDAVYALNIRDSSMFLFQDEAAFNRVPKTPLGTSQHQIKTGRVSASAVAVSKGAGEKGCFAIVVTESGELLVIDTGRLGLNARAADAVVQRSRLPGGGAEATPLLADLNRDGKLELVVACADGKVYALSTVWPASQGVQAGFPPRVRR